MRVETFQNNLQMTLENALKASKGQQKRDIHNALCRINKFLANATNRGLAEIKKFVKSQVINLDMYRGFKQKILKLLNKIK